MPRDRGAYDRAGRASDLSASAAVNRGTEATAQTGCDRRCPELLEICHFRAAADLPISELFARRLFLGEYLEGLAGRRHDPCGWTQRLGRAPGQQSGGEDGSD